MMMIMIPRLVAALLLASTCDGYWPYTSSSRGGVAAKEESDNDIRTTSLKKKHAQFPVEASFLPEPTTFEESAEEDIFYADQADEDAYDYHTDTQRNLKGKNKKGKNKKGKTKTKTGKAPAPTAAPVSSPPPSAGDDTAEETNIFSHTGGTLSSTNIDNTTSTTIQERTTTPLDGLELQAQYEMCLAHMIETASLETGKGKGDSGKSKGDSTAAVMEDTTTLEEAQALDAACQEAFPALQTPFGCLDPMNVIEDGFTPMLQTLLSTSSSKGKGSSGKSKGTSGNIRGRRNLKSSSKGTSCGGKSKGDALDDPLCEEDMSMITPFDLSLLPEGLVTPVGVFCYNPDPGLLLQSFVDLYSIQCSDVLTFAVNDCVSAPSAPPIIDTIIVPTEAPSAMPSIVGATMLIEGIPEPIGGDLRWNEIVPQSENNSGVEVQLQGWPVGTQLEYKVGNQIIPITITDENFPLKICGDSQEEVQTILDTLIVTAPPQIGEIEEFEVVVSVGSHGPTGKQTESYIHTFLVQAGPTAGPTQGPSSAPSGVPSVSPSVDPSSSPSVTPSSAPSSSPSASPSSAPSHAPSQSPSANPPFFDFIGASVLVEDVSSNVGVALFNGFVELLPEREADHAICNVTLGSFPINTTLTWEQIPGDSTSTESIIVRTSDFTIAFDDMAELQSLSLQAPPNSGDNFNMTVTSEVCGEFENGIQTFQHPVTVLAVADAPQVVATSPLEPILETETYPLDLTVVRSNDTDGSESLRVVFTLDPNEGTLVGNSTDLVIFTVLDAASGTYTLEVIGDGDPASQQELLNGFIDRERLVYIPPAGFVTNSFEEIMIDVRVESIEDADIEGVDLAPPTPTDPDTKIESVSTTIVISIAPDSASPSAFPSSAPSSSPSSSPSASPSSTPSTAPSGVPSATPSVSPSTLPSSSPSAAPSSTPSGSPSASPSASPSSAPSSTPSVSPSDAPSQSPSVNPPFFDYNGSSVLVEDESSNVGLEIVNGFIEVLPDREADHEICSVELANIPNGTTLMWVGDTGEDESVVVDSSTFSITFDDLAILATLRLQAPEHSDVDFVMSVTSTVCGDFTNGEQTHDHPVTVLAVADQPQVEATSPVGPILETDTYPLDVVIVRSNDTDGSESLFVVLTLDPADGTLSTPPGPGFESVVFTDLTNGTYTLEVSGDGDPALKQQVLNNFFDLDRVVYNPPADFVTNSPEGVTIDVQVISIEDADIEGVDLAFPIVTDPNRKIESVSTTIVFNVVPDSASPSAIPSSAPSTSPSSAPSSGPSSVPSGSPSATPSVSPSSAPSSVPSASPSLQPSSSPSSSPSSNPSSSPSSSPSVSPSTTPSSAPSPFPGLYTYDGSSVLVEDSASNIGTVILEGFDNVLPTDVIDPEICSIMLSGFPTNTTLTWIENGQTQTVVVDSPDYNVTFVRDSNTAFGTLGSLEIQAADQTDVDFDISVTSTVCGDFENGEQTFSHPVTVLAVADAPQVMATSPLGPILERDTVELDLTVARSNDTDGSERLIVVLTLDPLDGTLVGSDELLVNFTRIDDTTYTVEAIGEGDPTSKQELLNGYFRNGGITYNPPAVSLVSDSEGSVTIGVEVLSIEGANIEGVGLAFNNTGPTLGDEDTKIERVTTTIVITILPDSASPSAFPSSAPSSSPSSSPSASPSSTPSTAPSGVPSATPSVSPSTLPSSSPSVAPSSTPSGSPSASPSASPSSAPSSTPSVSPSDAPSQSPSVNPPFFDYNGSSVLVEDESSNVGLEIVNGFIEVLPDREADHEICSVELANIPNGTTLMWVGDTGEDESVVVDSSTFSITFDDLAILATLRLQAPEHSDVDFVMSVTSTVCGDFTNGEQTHDHPVTVLAVADQPQVEATSPVGPILETDTYPLDVVIVRSNDTDGSESLFVVLTLDPADGTLSTPPGPGFESVVFTDLTNGTYTLEVSGDGDPALKQQVLNNFFDLDRVVYNPPADFVTNSPEGVTIDVQVISIEDADIEGVDLAFPIVTDPNRKIESVSTTIVFNVVPDSASPSAIPSSAPSTSPSSAPSSGPSSVPSGSPSATPSVSPSSAPSSVPSASPSLQPSSSPSSSPSSNPSSSPSSSPSVSPSTTPSSAPSPFPGLYTYDGSSVLVEDSASNIGTVILEGFDNVLPTDVIDPEICSIMLSGFPTNTTLTWIENGQTQTVVVDSPDYNVTFVRDSNTAFGTLGSLEIQAADQTDVDFDISVTSTVCGDFENGEQTFSHPVTVLAVADAPQVMATSPLGPILERDTVELDLTVARSNDTDGSERLIVVVTLDPLDGTLVGSDELLVNFTRIDDTTYTVEAIGEGDPTSKQELLNGYFRNGGITYNPPAVSLVSDSEGSVTIGVEVLSIEGANIEGVGLAFNNTGPTLGDEDTKIERVTTTIVITILPDSASPSAFPSSAPSSNPSSSPSASPSSSPSTSPSDSPSSLPSSGPTPESYPFILSGSTVMNEDWNEDFGTDINWVRRPGRTEEAVEIRISGFLPQTNLNYTIGTTDFVVDDITDTDFELVLTADDEAALRAILDTLTMRAPPQSDEDFDLTVTIISGNDAINFIDSYTHPVIVRAVADTPEILSAEDIVIAEDDSSGGRLNITVAPSIDLDDSEVLSLRLTVPNDGGVVGELSVSGVIPAGYTFEEEPNEPGVYLLIPPAGTPTEEASDINSFFADNVIQFIPRDEWSGVLVGEDGIMVELISTENANGVIQLAPNNTQAEGTLFDEDTKVEIVTAYIGITITPVNEEVTMTSTQTIVDENNGAATGSPVLVVPIGANMDLSIADMDGSQTASVSLSGFPQSVVDAFNRDTGITGVTYTETDVGGTTTTLTFDGPANEVFAMIQSLEISLADDLDQDFDIEISGSLTDTGGAGQTVTNPITPLTHSVIVRATADEPTNTLPVPGTFNATTEILLLDQTVLENSGAVNYPVSVNVNDNDGSESIASVQLTVTTEGSSSNEPPIVTFTDTSATIVNMNNVITLTGTDEQINASLNSLMIQPGNDNGEDIIVEVTTTAIESSPSETGLLYEETYFSETESVTSVFQIEVIPVVARDVEIMNGNEPDSFNGVEDGDPISLGELYVDFESSLDDEDGSEQVYMDFQRDSFPEGSQFFTTDGTGQVELLVPTFVRVDNVDYVRFPGTILSDLKVWSILTPPDYSGTFDPIVRGTIIDTTSDGDETTVYSPPVTLPTVTVDPTADCLDFSTMTNSTTVEDLDGGSSAARVGIDIDQGLVIQDNGDPNPDPDGANNAEPEGISRIELEFSDELDFSLSTSFPGTGTTSTINGPNGDTTIDFDQTTNTVTITHSIIENARLNSNLEALTEAEIAEATSELRSALLTIRATNAVEQSDLNGEIIVRATSIDVNPDTQTFSETECEHIHGVRVQAYADPVMVTTEDITFDVYAEDDVRGVTGWNNTGITLSIVVQPSVDNLDASESLEVTIQIPMDVDYEGVIGKLNFTGALPDGFVFTADETDGLYTITPDPDEAPVDQADALNDFIQNQMEFYPSENWAGTLTGDDGIQVTVTTTEDATGNEVSRKIATDTAYIGIDILPRADEPSVKFKGNAIGTEDTLIQIPIEVRVADEDSETFELIVRGDSVPEGARLYGAGGTEIFPGRGGDYVLSERDADSFFFLPPEHWSDFSGTIDLTVYVEVTDTTNTSPAQTDVIQTQDYSIPVFVNGIADKPLARELSFRGTEDVDYPLGDAILAELSNATSFDGLLVDADGSESLEFRITNVGSPDRIIVDEAFRNNGNVTALGGGAYSITPAAMLTLKLKAQPHFSGISTDGSLDSWYSDVTVSVSSQEADTGSVAYSDDWPVVFDVVPVVDGDGIGNLQPSISTTEGENESGGDIFLFDLNVDANRDTDGSESVLEFTIDFNTLLDDAAIKQRLADLTPGVSSPDDVTVAMLINNYLIQGDGAFTNNNDGTITVAAAGGFGSATGGLRLSGELFLDSSVNFEIPFTALVQDRAVLLDGEVTVTTTQSGSYSVSISGTADTPTVFAETLTGTSSPVQLNMGGDFTDTDVALGRNQSESIYFLLKRLDTGNFSVAFVDSIGAGAALVGFGAGDDEWFFSADDLQNDVFLIAPSGTNATAEFELIAITEEDGTRAQNATGFFVDILAGEGTGPDAPLAPLMIIGTNTAVEDNPLTLDIDLERDPNESDNITAVYSLVIENNLPDGFSIPTSVESGVVLNDDGTAFIISKEALDEGNVTVTAPPDFAGDLPLNVQAIATSLSFLTTSTPTETLTLQWTPAADGPQISATTQSLESPESTTLNEDFHFTVDLSIEDIDVDGSETLGEWVIIEFGAGYNTEWSFEFLGASTVASFTVDGVQINNGINVSIADLDQLLTIMPSANWHGDVPITVHGFTTEALDPTVVGWAHTPFNFAVQAVPDPPNLTVNTITVPEFTRQNIAGLLAAEVADDVVLNGPEEISVTLYNVPEGAQFFLRDSTERYGGFVQPGVYTIPNAADLPFLQFLGPQYVSGSFDVTMSSLVVETSNSAELLTLQNFTIVLQPVGTGVLLLTKDISMDNTASVPLDLNVRIEDQLGDMVGENPPEIVELTFDFPVSDTLYLRPTQGGQLERTSPSSWTFRGTEEQANSIVMVNTLYSGDDLLIGTSGVSVDAENAKSPLSTDDFDFKVEFETPLVPGESIETADALYNATFGNDFIITTDGSAQTILANDGDDIIFIKSGGKTVTGGLGADTFVLESSGNDIVLTDFNPAEGDQLNLGSLVNFDVYDDVPSNFVQISGTTLSVSPNGDGNFTPIAQLQGYSGTTDVDALFANGNLAL